MNQKKDEPPAVTGEMAGKPERGEPQQADAMPDGGESAPEGDLDLARLAPQLRGLYQELLDEPIPDRFSNLLDELARKESDAE